MDPEAHRGLSQFNYLESPSTTCFCLEAVLDSWALRSTFACSCRSWAGGGGHISAQPCSGCCCFVGKESDSWLGANVTAFNRVCCWVVLVGDIKRCVLGVCLFHAECSWQALRFRRDAADNTYPEHDACVSAEPRVYRPGCRHDRHDHAIVLPKWPSAVEIQELRHLQWM